MRTPVSVITGFLGSGKTTLLNALLRHPEMRDTAVLVNEFGEIGIDHLLVEELLDEKTVLLSAGCLCCTIRDDLVGSLVSLHERRAAGEIPPFRQAVIETTGLADPAPILHTLLGHEALENRFRVDAIVTAVDAVNGSFQLDRYPESLRQAAVADRLVLTKTDLAPESLADALRARLRRINRGAPLIEARHGEVAPSRLFGAGHPAGEDGGRGIERWLNEPAYREQEGHDHHDVNRHDDRIRAWCLEAERPLPMSRFIAWVERLIERHGDALLRLKGVLDIDGSEVPIVVHGVQHVFHPLSRLERWPSGGRRSRIVVIVNGLDREQVVEGMEDLLCRASPPAARAAARGRPRASAGRRLR